MHVPRTISVMTVGSVRTGNAASGQDLATDGYKRAGIVPRIGEVSAFATVVSLILMNRRNGRRTGAKNDYEPNQ